MTEEPVQTTGDRNQPAVPETQLAFRRHGLFEEESIAKRRDEACGIEVSDRDERQRLRSARAQRPFGISTLVADRAIKR